MKTGENRQRMTTTLTINNYSLCLTEPNARSCETWTRGKCTGSYVRLGQDVSSVLFVFDKWLKSLPLGSGPGSDMVGPVIYGLLAGSVVVGGGDTVAAVTTLHSYVHDISSS